MRKGLISLLLVIFCFAQAEAATSVSGRPAPGRVSTTNYCNDANAQLCLFMNGNGTDETDRSANGYTITDSASSPATSATVPTGYSGTSRSFVAASDTLLTCTEANCPNLDIYGADATITIVVWVKFATVPASAGTMGLVQKHSVYLSQRQYQLNIMGTGSSQFKIQANICPTGTAANILDSATTTYVADTWYHVAVVYNDTDVRIYVNGALDCTPKSLTTGIYNGSSVLRIGVQTNASDSLINYFNGLMDEVAIFNRALSAAEILDIYTNGLTGNKGGSD